MDVCMYVCMHAYMYACMHACMHVHVWWCLSIVVSEWYSLAVGEDIDLSDGASLEVFFDAGQLARNISLPFIDDIFPEEDETFEILLTTSPGVFLSPYTRTVVTITNDDPDLPGGCGQSRICQALSHS